MLNPTSRFPIPKPILSGLAILTVVMILGAIYVWDVSRTETISVSASLEGDGCDADGVDCRLVRKGETKVQLKNCDESDELCRKGRYAISEKDGFLEVYSLKSEAITFIEEEIIIEVAEVGEFIYEQDRYSQVERAASMATDCQIPEEGQVLGAECYEMELTEDLLKSETEERRAYVALRDRLKSYFN
jgi:hypothetical protein